MRRILVCLDHSVRAPAVFLRACELAYAFDAELILFHVVAVPQDFPAAGAGASADALRPVTVPRYSVIPDCMSPLNPACEIAVGDQVERLHAISSDEVLADIHTVFGPAPPPQWHDALRRPRAWLEASGCCCAAWWHRGT